MKPSELIDKEIADHPDWRGEAMAEVRRNTGKLAKAKQAAPRAKGKAAEGAAPKSKKASGRK